MRASAKSSPKLTAPEAVRVVGRPEAVGEAGVVFPVGEEQALVDALADLREHPERRRGYGRAARERVERAYTAQRLVDDMAAVYVRALEPAGGR